MELIPNPYEFFAGIADVLSSNIDLFLINISAIFFAYTYMRSKKDWEDSFKATTSSETSWETLVEFKEDPHIKVSEESMVAHPTWTIVGFSREISIDEYAQFLAYDNYDETYETKYADGKKSLYFAWYGVIVLIIGSFMSLFIESGDFLLSLVVIVIYIFMALLVVAMFSYLIEPSVKVRPRPPRPTFLDEQKNG